MKTYLTFIENIRHHIEHVWQLNNHLVQQTDEAKETGMSYAEASILLELQEKCTWGREFIKSNGLEMLDIIRTEIGTGILKQDTVPGKKDFAAEIMNRIQLLKSYFQTIFHNTDLSIKALHFHITNIRDGEARIEETTVYALVGDIEKYIKALEFTIREELNIQNMMTANTPVGSLAKTQLHPLSGCWKGVAIMTPEEHLRLLKYAQNTVDTNTLPKNIKPIGKGFSNLPLDFYRQIIYRLWKATKGGTTKEIWISFLKTVFADHFKRQEVGTLNKKFSTYPGRFETDSALITYP